MDLIDSHSHIDAPEFDTDRELVLERARAAGVTLQIVPAVSAAGWPNLRSLSLRHADLRPAYGLHPLYLAQHTDAHLQALPEWIARESPVAVGECGLDYFVEGLDATRQREVFVQQLRVAREAELPVIVHARRAVDEVIDTVRRIGALRGVIHSFGGSLEQARQLYRLGFKLGIGGPVTYERATRLRTVVASVPLDQLLIETDAPDQPLASHRGERNEPCRLPAVLAAIARARGDSETRIAEATRDNARDLFRLQ